MKNNGISIANGVITNSRLNSLKKDYSKARDSKAKRQIQREITKVERELREEVSSFWNEHMDER